MEWWKDAIIYQIYPRSFQDSNGDGIGDIPGIISRLDHLQELGVGAIWLSPVYRSPNADNGYDISDYREINPEYGTMEDMENLIAEAGKRQIRIIMDLVINHTSTSHYWFRQSRDRTSGYADYYYWRRGGADGALPNNWTGFFGEDCWEFDPERCEYYLHLFAKSQADLNYHNPAVLEEVKDILRFWLRKGVAGFRCDVINILWKDSLENGKKKLALTGSEHYLSLEGTHEILRQLREVLDEYGAFTVGETVFVTPGQARELCGRERKELDMVFSFEHMECDQFLVKWLKRKFRPKAFFACLTKWQKELDWNAIYLENHDQPRSISRFGSEAHWKESGKLLALLALTLRGTPFLYQGQEIGMLNFDFDRMRQLNDVESKNVERVLRRLHIPRKARWRIISRTSRDNARTPFQWTGEPGAGFTDGRPWLGINHNCEDINLARQEQDPDSIWNWYKDLAALRNDSAVLRRGTFLPLETGEQVFAYRRELEGEGLTIVLNFSGKPARTAQQGRVLRSNIGRETFDGQLAPWEAVILQ
ncbi:MAG: alpha-glucosidase [Oscillospiraceae bacterium]|nr:alpha-glucosidase [Oscillospiraceae bacterium]